MMEFIIISGLSGAGKSRAADVFEDLNYYCIDNMPVALLPKFAQLCLATDGLYKHVALVTDIRELEGIDTLFNVLAELTELGIVYRILFMEAEPAVLVKRYKESRRRHPLAAPGLTIEQSIDKEIAYLAPVRERADHIIDSSRRTLGMLQSEIYRLFVGGDEKQKLFVTVMSFGYKYGIPLESDLVIDVRFMPNPFYVTELKQLTGLDDAVSEYVFQPADSKEFIEKFKDIVNFLLPRYVDEGKLSLTISVGCTGGRHRSVAVAKALCDYISGLGYESHNINRDIWK